MTLKQINKLWDEYKRKYDIDSDLTIAEVRYDTEEYVEGCFNLLELMDGKYILHLNPKFHLYSESYVKFILFHEFTHFYDFFHCPYEEKEDLLLFMNAYSEYHACRVTLARTLEQTTVYSVHVDKMQVPGPYNEISIRRLLEESLFRVKYYIDLFFFNFQLNDIINGCRHLMYLFGYLSLFHNDKELVKQTMRALRVDDERFLELYDALKEEDFDQVIDLYRRISDDFILIYLRASFRRFYDRDLLPDDEIKNITKDNYQDYIEELERKKAMKKLEQSETAQAAFAFRWAASSHPEPEFVKEIKKFYLEID